VFTPASLALTFLICAGMFGTMALYGLVTKSDLSGMGTYLFMALIGIIIASVINIFVRSSGMDFVISLIGVIIFTLLTAYDVQMIKQMGMVMIANDEEITKVSIVCSLKLYLDFVNLFLYLLRFFGQKKD
jgi:FtsH-binding integral membrane protein